MALILEYIKKQLCRILCVHKKQSARIYYRTEEKYGTRAINVYLEKTCEECGHITTELISEYSSVLFNLANIEKILVAKGISNIEDIIVKEIKMGAI